MRLFKLEVFIIDGSIYIDRRWSNICLLDVETVRSDHLDLMHILVGNLVAHNLQFSEVLIIRFIQTLLDHVFNTFQEGIVSRLMLQSKNIDDERKFFLFSVELLAILLNFSHLL
jgi:hypothetical protein